MAKGIYKNDNEVPLSVAVWLANNEYDFVPTINRISTTDLLKSTRQLVLRNRRMQQEAVEGVKEDSLDIMKLVASKMGTAIHDSIEQSWRTNAKQSLIDLGYPERVADRVVINPTPEQVEEGDIVPVYMEIRGEREIEGYTISGKFDFCIEGGLEDFKSTGVFTYMNNTGDDKFVKQGSIYRWIHEDIVTDDVFSINYIFTDWSAAMAKSSANYPKYRIMQSKYNLMSLFDTESFIRGKLRHVKSHLETPEPELPDCNSEELWQKDPVYKYYKNPATAQKGGRSTKNFDTMPAALQRKSDDGNIGVVVEKPGEVVACKYCNEFEMCTQKDRLIAAGLLNME